MFVPSLVVLLALGAQSAVIHLEEVPDLLGVHSTSVYRDEPPIDLTKSLIIPNLRIFSDITRIFYAPGSDEPVSLQYTCEIPGTDILTKGFGIIPCACHKEELYCACCVYVRLERINFERTACSNLTIHRNSLELDMTIDYSGYTLAKRTISLRDPPPFCIPIPQIPALLSCIRVHDINIRDNSIEFCINFEIMIVAIPNPVFILEFTCINYSEDGFILERPASHHHLHDNGTKPQTSANLDLLHQHLVTSGINPASGTQTVVSSQTVTSSGLVTLPGPSPTPLLVSGQTTNVLSGQTETTFLPSGKYQTTSVKSDKYQTISLPSGQPLTSSVSSDKYQVISLPSGQSEKSSSFTGQSKISSSSGSLTSSLTSGQSEKISLPLGESETSSLTSGNYQTASLPFGQSEKSSLFTGQSKISSLPSSGSLTSSLTSGQSEKISLPFGESETSSLTSGNYQTVSLPFGQSEKSSSFTGQSKILPSSGSLTSSLTSGQAEKISLPFGESETSSLTSGNYQTESLPFGQSEKSSSFTGQSKISSLPSSGSLTSSLTSGQSEKISLPFGESETSSLTSGQTSSSGYLTGGGIPVITPVVEGIAGVAETASSISGQKTSLPLGQYKTSSSSGYLTGGGIPVITPAAEAIVGVASLPFGQSEKSTLISGQKTSLPFGQSESSVLSSGYRTSGGNIPVISPAAEVIAGVASLPFGQSEKSTLISGQKTSLPFGQSESSVLSSGYRTSGGNIPVISPAAEAIAGVAALPFGQSEKSTLISGQKTSSLFGQSETSSLSGYHSGGVRIPVVSPVVEAIAGVASLPFEQSEKSTLISGQKTSLPFGQSESSSLISGQKTSLPFGQSETSSVSGYQSGGVRIPVVSPVVEAIAGVAALPFGQSEKSTLISGQKTSLPFGQSESSSLISGQKTSSLFGESSSSSLTKSITSVSSQPWLKVGASVGSNAIDSNDKRLELSLNPFDARLDVVESNRNGDFERNNVASVGASLFGFGATEKRSGGYLSNRLK